MKYEILDFVEEDYKTISKFINSDYRKDLINILALKKSNTFLNNLLGNIETVYSSTKYFTSL